MNRLLTAEQEAEMRLRGQKTNGGDEFDYVPAAKVFIENCRCFWLLTDRSPFYEGQAFGLCDLGMGEPELGNVYLPELELFKHATTDEWLVTRDDMFKPVHTLQFTQKLPE
jgi:hypothetical protein